MRKSKICVFFTRLIVIDPKIMTRRNYQIAAFMYRHDMCNVWSFMKDECISKALRGEALRDVPSDMMQPYYCPRASYARAFMLVSEPL